MVGLHGITKNEFLCLVISFSRIPPSGKKIEDRAWEVLKFFNLETKGHWLASSLSYGDQKRIEMARAFAPRPRLILLDEPVAGLNINETLEVARLISEIRAQGTSVLLVEHDMNLVMGISDNVVVLNYGKKIADGRPEEVQVDEQVMAAYLGSVA